MPQELFSRSNTENLTAISYNPDPVIGYLQSRKDLEQALERVPQSASSADESYITAMMICSADRKLMLDFFDAWRFDEGLQKDARQVEELLTKATEALQGIKEAGLIVDNAESQRLSHLSEMCENSEIRREIASVLAAPGLGRESKCVQVDEWYAHLGAVASKRPDVYTLKKSA